jgi:hypothetical protein
VNPYVLRLSYWVPLFYIKGGREVCWSPFLELVGVSDQDFQAENVPLILDLPAPKITEP